MGHLNGILARVGGNLKNNFQKSQMHVWLLGGGRLKLQFDRYIIPTALRSSILHKLYAAHGGPDFTFGHARNTVFWPGLTPQVKDIHTNYPTCAQHTTASSRATAAISRADTSMATSFTAPLQTEWVSVPCHSRPLQ